MKEIRIAVVEDEPIVGMDIVANLTHLGYKAEGPFEQGGDLIKLVKKNPPDLVLMDINLAGGLDGIETAEIMLKLRKLPLIFITASSDDTTKARAKKLRPHAYIIKPFNFHNLHSAIELALYNYSCAESSEERKENTGLPRTNGYAGYQAIFIRKTNSRVFEKMPLEQVVLLAAEGSYTKIVTTEDKFTICTNLQRILDKLHVEQFLRVHRSYAINLNHINKVLDDHLLVGEIEVPISNSYREKLLKKLNVL